MKFITKVFTLMLLAIAFSTAVTNAQLSTVEPSAKKFKGGNRAEAGDFGLYMGLTSDMFKGWFDGGLKVTALPLLNFKYMATDNWEVRLGFEFYKQRTKYKGDAIVDSETVRSDLSSQVESRNYFYPGFAYHFTPKNLLDVYVGAELPFGWSKNSNNNEMGKSSYSIKKTSFDIGLGAFIGLQAYIADLPFAIGVEYGISSLFQTGLKYKNESVDEEGNKKVFYTKDPEIFGESSEKYENLKAKKGEIGQQFRITFTYYFKK